MPLGFKGSNHDELELKNVSQIRLSVDGIIVEVY